MQSDNYLFWLDLEMTGLNHRVDKILEIASLITNNNLEVIAIGPHLVIHQTNEALEAMDDWNKEHHGASGLISLVQQSTITVQDAANATLEFMQAYCKPKSAPLCGNTIYQDRAFLKIHMVEVDQFLHYRNIDVSSVKELVRRWYPTHSGRYFKKPERHRAAEDVMASVEELKYYRTHFFVPLETSKNARGNRL